MVRDRSRLDMDIGGVAEAEAGVGGCVSARRQRREEREKRLRGRDSSAVVVVGLKECTDGADRSGPVRSEADPRRRSRLLFDCIPPLEEIGVRVSDDFDRGGLDMLATGRCRELEAIGGWVSPRA